MSDLQNQPEQEPRPWGLELNIYCMLMHLALFLGFVIPGAGLILVIVMWAVNKDKFPEVNLHGLILFNFMLSMLIYSIVCFILTFLLIGVFLFFVLYIVAIIFVIIAAVKANDREYWPYPATIDFFGVHNKLARLDDA